MRVWRSGREGEEGCVRPDTGPSPAHALTSPTRCHHTLALLPYCCSTLPGLLRSNSLLRPLYLDLNGKSVFSGTAKNIRQRE